MVRDTNGRFAKGPDGDSTCRWKKGKSGNPGGRPRKKTAREHIETVAGIKGQRSAAKLLMRALLEGEIELPNGRVIELDAKEWKSFYELLLDRLDGKPMQPVQVEEVAQVAEFTSEDFEDAAKGLKEWEDAQNGSDVKEALTTSSTIM